MVKIHRKYDSFNILKKTNILKLYLENNKLNLTKSIPAHLVMFTFYNGRFQITNQVYLPSSYSHISHFKKIITNKLVNKKNNNKTINVNEFMIL